MSGFIGLIGFLLFICVGIAQLYIGFLGIEYHFGAIWATIALVAAFPFRFTLPITIGTFFGAIGVLGWSWYMALLITVPGLLLIFPAILAVFLNPILEFFGNTKPESVANESVTIEGNFSDVDTEKMRKNIDAVEKEKPKGWS